VNGLANGTYYMLVTNGSGLVDQLWQNRPCPGGSCDVTLGDAIDLEGAEVPQAVSFLQSGSVKISKTQAVGSGARLGFALVRGTKMAGSVRNEAGEPLKFVKVYFFDSLGKLAGETTTDGLGNFVSPTSFPDGAYHAATSAPGKGGVGGGYIDEIFGDVACAGECILPATGATTIGIGEPGADPDQIHFVLGTGKTISGQVSVYESGLPLASATVQLYKADGSPAGSRTTSGSGTYRFEGLIPDTYYALASHPSGDYTVELFDGVDCSEGCDVVAEGTAIVVDSLDIGTIDFALSDGSCPFQPGPDHPDSDGDGLVDECERNPPSVDPGANVDPTVLLGDGAQVGLGSTLDKNAEVGADASIGEYVSISAEVTIGAGAEIGAGSILERGAHIGALCVLGERVGVGRDSVLGESTSEDPDSVALEGCLVGDDTTIGANVLIGVGVAIGSNTRLDREVTIEDEATVGNDVAIGRGATLAEGAIVCDGAVVSKNTLVEGEFGCP
jgi:acetyltransferase-like isoleucine patch superfamily enzyme